ncbi:MAG: 50S ribosomal protein L9 [Lentisphaeria bacterium]|nr:50S ribosomal protein L9 [Lentisphaeria bacterium]
MASTKVILLEDIQGLGKIGDEANVAPGYARNFLLPRGLCVEVPKRGKSTNVGVLRQLERKRKIQQERYAQELADAQQFAETVGKQTVTISMQAQEDGKLFGSVSAQQIVSGLADASVTVDRRQVQLSDAIRKIGSYTVDIHLHPEVTAQVKVYVVKMEE